MSNKRVLTSNNEDRLLASDGRLDVGVGLCSESFNLAACKEKESDVIDTSPKD